MNTKTQLVCLYSGYAFFPIYLIGFVLFAGFIPTIPPSWEGVEIVRLFEENQMGILIGMSLCVIASSLLVPLAVAIFDQMIRIESGNKLMAYVQLLSGAIGAVFFMTPSFVWAAMAYRHGHSPDTMQLLNDFAWIGWVISWPSFAVQAIAISIAVFVNKGAEAIIPRWVAYVSLWLGITLIPASLVLFFTSGPFAWNGLIAIYVPLVIYAIWINVIFVTLLKAIKAQAQAQAQQ